jgi:hypothetical protein
MTLSIIALTVLNLLGKVDNYLLRIGRALVELPQAIGNPIVSRMPLLNT